MKTVWIHSGSVSNNRNCFALNVNGSEPDTAAMGRMLASAAGNGYGTVRLFGGEPTVRRDFLKVLAAARSLGLLVELNTNGRLFSYPEMVTACVNAGLSGVFIELCGPDAATHDSVVGTVSFSQTMAGIENAVSAGLNVGIDIPVCTSNMDMLVETGMAAMKTGVSSVCFRLVEAGTQDRLNIVPDIRNAASCVSRAIAAMDLRAADGFRIGYADFPCCLMPDLKGREFPGYRQDGLISPVEGVPIVAAGGSPARAMPVPCTACELKRHCSTLERVVVEARGSVDVHLPLHSPGSLAFCFEGLAAGPVVSGKACPYRDDPGLPRPGIERLHLVLDRNDDMAEPPVTEIWRSSASVDKSILMHVKNIRSSLVHHSGNRLLQIDPLCASCEFLSSCAAVFHLSPDAAAHAPTNPQAVVLDASGAVVKSAEFLKWSDFSSDFSDFMTAAAGRTVKFEADAPWGILMRPGSGDSADHAESEGSDVTECAASGHASACVEPLILWEAARVASMCELTDYVLPYANPRFELSIRSASRWAEVDRMGTILIIRTCTMDCIICQVQKYYRGRDIMPLPDVVRFLEEFRLLGYTRLDLFGGEPTMRRDLVDLVAFAHRLGFYTDLITNGTLMTDELACALRDAGLDLCIVSLDGPTPEIHDKIRRVKNGHERAVSGIEAVVRARGMEVNVDTVVLPENIDHLIDLASQVGALGVTRINMFLCLEGPISSPVPRLLGFDRTLDFYERIVPEMRRIGEKYGTAISVGPRLLTAGRPIAEVARSRMFRNITEGTYNVIYDQPDIVCKAPDDEVYISLFGDVFPCTAPQMLESSANMGNAYRRKLIEIVRSSEWNGFRKIAGHHEGCRMCWRAHFDLDREGEERVLDSDGA